MELVEPSPPDQPVDPEQEEDNMEAAETSPEEETPTEFVEPSSPDQPVDTNQEENVIKVESFREEETPATAIGRCRELCSTIQEQIIMRRIVIAVLVCMWRYFVSTWSHKPLAVTSTPLAHCITACFWAMMGAFLRSAFQHNCCNETPTSI